MGSVIWHVSMSLDGFITGPDDTMDWVMQREAGLQSAMAVDVMKGIGAMLAGRRWYDVATARFRGIDGLYGGAWSGPVFILTHRPPEGVAHPAATFVSSGTIEEAVSAARTAARGRNVGILGANVAQQCLQAGLVEEILVHLVPVLLGDGVRLYGDHLREIGLERTAIAQSGQNTDLRFRVVRGRDA
jgi:dihydrofolate reductase